MSGANLEGCALRLRLPDVVTRKSRKVFQQWKQINIYPSRDFQGDSLWSTCAIYTAVIECRSEVESPSEEFPDITLQQILKAAQVNMKSFLDCMDYILNVYEQSNALKDTFPLNTKKKYFSTKKKYGITLDMYQTFQRLMDEIFQTIEKRKMPLSKKDAVVTAVSYLAQHSRRVCWCLFLVAKETLYKNAEEVNPVQLLLICCIHYIMKQVPLFMLKECFRTAKSTDVTDGFANSCMLSEINDACARGTGINMDLAELLAAQASLFEPFLKKFPQGKLNQGAEGLPELGYLEKKYETLLNEKVADIDEMAFLDNDPVLMPIGATSPDTTRGDVRQPVLQTPARTPTRTVPSLNTILANATDKPSCSLLTFLHEYGDNLASAINQRIESLKEIFVKAHLQVCRQIPKTTAETRFRLGVRLYYREMENILKKERARQVDSSSIKNLLSGDVFHKCLLACSLEVVKVTKESCASPGQTSPINIGGLTFPWILSIFNLHAYDVCKVIETFIKEEPLLSEEAVEYLIRTEEFILERQAWKEGSPLFDALKMKGILRNSKNEHLPSSRVEASSENPQDRDVFLNTFLMKMQQLGYKRLKEMCTALEISGELENRMWACLDHCIMEQPGLLKNHHLDQIIMCCILELIPENRGGIAQIISVYSEMLQTVSNTYKHVMLNDGTYGHISDFYKLVFTDALKDDIARYHPVRQSTQGSPGQSRSLSSTPNQQESFHLTPNFRISPLTASLSSRTSRPSPSGSQGHMTSKKPSLLQYEFGKGQNSAKLEEFNKTFLEAKRKTQRQEPFQFKKKLKLEDSKCEVGSNTDGSKQATREESISTGVSSEGDRTVSGMDILRDRLAKQRADSSTEDWFSDDELEETQEEDKSDECEEDKNGHEDE